MKVLLINPAAVFELKGGTNVPFIEETRGHNPPLGLLYLAGSLLEKTSHDVEIVDMRVEELGYRELESRLRGLDFQVVGITVTTFTLLDAMETVKAAKRVNPACKVVLGGPHVTIFPEETIRLPDVDFLVLGEGENTFVALLENIDNSGKLEKIGGLVFKDPGGRVVKSGDFGFIEDLDSLPIPARRLVPYRKYSSVLLKRKPVTTLFTSRGCPYNCSFCHKPHLGRKFRALGPGRVVEEIERCIDLGIREFLVYDDTFTVDKGRVKKICESVIRRGLDIGFDVRARVDTLDGELLSLLAEAGCRGIHYGIEAGTEKILKVLRKEIDLEKAKQIFDLTRRHHIQVLAYFMIGSPTETRQDIRETFRVARWLDPDYLHLTILTPFPQTPIYLEGLRTGAIRHDYWRAFARSPDKNFVPPFWEGNLSRQELERLLHRGYKDFYSRPSYILKKLFSLRSFGEFRSKAGAGLKILFMKDKNRPGD